MKQFKGTPGPWVAEYNNDVVLNDSFIEFYDIVDSNGMGIGEIEKVENAHLIAAAPELLEALQSCLGWVNNGLARDAHEKAVAAINKALGGE